MNDGTWCAPDVSHSRNSRSAALASENTVCCSSAYAGLTPASTGTPSCRWAGGLHVGTLSSPSLRRAPLLPKSRMSSPRWRHDRRNSTPTTSIARPAITSLSVACYADGIVPDMRGDIAQHAYAAKMMPMPAETSSQLRPSFALSTQAGTRRAMRPPANITDFQSACPANAFSPPSPRTPKRPAP